MSNPKTTEELHEWLLNNGCQYPSGPAITAPDNRTWYNVYLGVDGLVHYETEVDFDLQSFTTTLEEIVKMNRVYSPSPQ